MPEPTNEELRQACEDAIAMCPHGPACPVSRCYLARALLSRLDREAEAERRLKVAREAIEQAKNDFDTIAYAHSSEADFQTQETLRENWQHTFDHAWNSRARCEDALAEIAPAAPEGEKP